MNGLRVVTKVICSPDQHPERLGVFVQDAEFTAAWRRCGYTDDDLREIEVIVRLDTKNNPGIPGAGGIKSLCYEQSKEKLILVWYIYFHEASTTYLLAVDDGEIDDGFTEEELLKLREKVTVVTAEICRPRMV